MAGDGRCVAESGSGRLEVLVEEIGEGELSFTRFEFAMNVGG